MPLKSVGALAAAMLVSLAWISTAQATDWEDVTLAVYNAATTARRITFENFLNTSLDY